MDLNSCRLQTPVLLRPQHTHPRAGRLPLVLSRPHPQEAIPVIRPAQPCGRARTHARHTALLHIPPWTLQAHGDSPPSLRLSCISGLLLAHSPPSAQHTLPSPLQALSPGPGQSPPPLRPPLRRAQAPHPSSPGAVCGPYDADSLLLRVTVVDDPCHRAPRSRCR